MKKVKEKQKECTIYVYASEFYIPFHSPRPHNNKRFWVEEKEVWKGGHLCTEDFLHRSIEDTILRVKGKNKGLESVKIDYQGKRYAVLMTMDGYFGRPEIPREAIELRKLNDEEKSNLRTELAKLKLEDICKVIY